MGKKSIFPGSKVLTNIGIGISKFQVSDKSIEINKALTT